MKENNLIPFPKEIVLLSAQRKYDPNTEDFYTETKWECRGHKVDVNIDEYGYHARIDEGTCYPNMNEGQLIEFILWFLEEHHDIRIQMPILQATIQDRRANDLSNREG